mgnify:CR=1 FL=1
MAFTRFHDDPCRIQKYLEETTNIGNYAINVPGNGATPHYIEDPHLRMQKWGANLSNNKTDLESDLRGQTRKLNRDTINENKYDNYLNKNTLYYLNIYPENKDEITHQPRATHPAWELRELNSITQKAVPNNFNYLHMNLKSIFAYLFKIIYQVE